jgi:NAD(P)-dependent dehydrogenase (short-subunit alcohol dehydrogenase family)
MGVAEAAIRPYGGFDSWVNNACIGVFGRLDDISDADSHRVFDVNFWGLVYGTKIASIHLRLKRGAIINLGSVVTDVGFPVQGMYAASSTL